MIIRATELFRYTACVRHSRAACASRPWPARWRPYHSPFVQSKRSPEGLPSRSTPEEAGQATPYSFLTVSSGWKPFKRAWLLSALTNPWSWSMVSARRIVLVHYVELPQGAVEERPGFVDAGALRDGEPEVLDLLEGGHGCLAGQPTPRFMGSSPGRSAHRASTLPMIP